MIFMRFVLFVLPLLSLFLISCGFFTSHPQDFQASRIFQEARINLREENYAQAVEKYEELEEKFPFSPYSARAKLEVSFANYQIGEYEKANVTLIRFIRNNRNFQHLDYAYFLNGVVSYYANRSYVHWLFTYDPSTKDTSALQESLQNFEYIVRNYPESTYYAASKNFRVVIRNLLSLHELRVATFYYKLGAYIATVNRMKYMLENYDGTQYIPQGLYVLSKAYHKISQPKLAKYTLKVLHLNFPDFLPGRVGALEDKENQWFAGINDLLQQMMEGLKLKPGF